MNPVWRNNNANTLYLMVVIMSIGNSGRIVIEIEPELKRKLHSVLRLEGTNLKTWFLNYVEELLADKGQQSLPFDESLQVKEAQQ